MEQRAMKLTDEQLKILEHIAISGPIDAKTIAERIDNTSHYVGRHCRTLVEINLITRTVRRRTPSSRFVAAFYEITDDGIECLEETTC